MGKTNPLFREGKGGNMNIVYQEQKSKDYSIYAFGKKWDSIAQCCEHYKVSYYSVIQYKSDHKCDTETALQKYIDYKKNHGFYFRKKKWTSMKECCDYYNINYESVIVLNGTWKLPPEEALKKYIKMDKDRKFIFDGITYNSFADCCYAYSVNPILVKRYGEKKKLMKRRALIGYLKYKREKKETNAFLFAGMTYVSFKECCECYGIKVQLVRDYAKRQEVSLYSALIHYIITNKIKSPCIGKQNEFLMPITYKGIYYQTIILCCEVLLIDLELVCQMKKNSTRKIQDIISELDKKNMRMNRRQDSILSRGFCYKNVYYPSMGICCNTLGLNEKHIYSRLWREGETMESVLDFYVAKKESRKE